jgi:hypothetical protein
VQPKKLLFVAGRRLLGEAKSVRNWRISGIREKNESISTMII